MLRATATRAAHIALPRGARGVKAPGSWKAPGAADAREGGFSTGLGMGFFIGAGSAASVQMALNEFGSGKAEFARFGKMIGGTSDLDKLFGRIDRDGNGYIAGKELYTVCACFDIDVVTMAKMFEAADVNKDGKLTKGEFKKVMGSPSAGALK